jgi:hypothetical protein
MALSAQQVGTSLGGGYVNTLGGPVDPYYAQANGTPWASLADACAAVPTNYRRSRTVNVGNVEYWWLAEDLSDNGLVLKTPAGTPGSGGGTPAIYADFSFTVETDGAQSFALPSGTLGVSDVLQVVQTPLLPPTDDEPESTAKDRGIRLADFRFSQGNLLVDANANLKQGDILIGRRFYGGVPTTGGGDAGDTGGDTGDGDGSGTTYTDQQARDANASLFDELRAQIAQLQDYVFAQNLDIDPDQRTADVGPGDDYTFTTEPLN